MLNYVNSKFSSSCDPYLKAKLVEFVAKLTNIFEIKVIYNLLSPLMVHLERHAQSSIYPSKFGMLSHLTVKWGLDLKFWTI